MASTRQVNAAKQNVEEGAAGRNEEAHDRGRFAKRQNIPGRSRMGKSELIAAIRRSR